MMDTGIAATRIITIAMAMLKRNMFQKIPVMVAANSTTVRYKSPIVLKNIDFMYTVSSCYPLCIYVSLKNSICSPSGP